MVARVHPPATREGFAVACPFCEIVTGSLPAHVVVDEAGGVGFLDQRPVFKGHVLVVPRAHHETMLDIDPASLAALVAVVQRVAAALEVALGAGGSWVAVNNRVSQSVPHLHVHVVPRTRGDGLRGFFWPRTRYDDDEEAASYAQRLREALAGDGGPNG